MTMQTHVGFCIDESGSVARIVNALIDAYNNNVDGIRESVLAEGQEASMTALTFGDRVLKHRILYTGEQVQTVRPLKRGDIKPSGLTPLFDSVYRAIKKLEELDDGKEDTTFIISVVTDGFENSSRKPGVHAALALMKEKIDTDRWSFAFLVPNGNGESFSQRWGVPLGNVQEWDSETAIGTETAFVVNTTAFQSYFGDKSKGVENVRGSKRSFYADLGETTVRTARTKLSKITSQVELIEVMEECTIKEAALAAGCPFMKGALFYQLVKTEKRVQPYKMVVVRVKSSGEYYSGDEGRAMIGLNATDTVRLKPGDFGKFDIFIQSTSHNRKVHPGTEIVYWTKFGQQKK